MVDNARHVTGCHLTQERWFRTRVRDVASKNDRAWHILRLLATSEHGVQLNKRRFTMRVDDVAGRYRPGLTLSSDNVDAST